MVERVSSADNRPVHPPTELADLYGAGWSARTIDRLEFVRWSHEQRRGPFTEQLVRVREDGALSSSSE